MKKREKKLILCIILLILIVILSLYTIRIFSPREIDDLSPEIFCDPIYLNKSNILWVIPEFNNKPISNNKEWCNLILSLNKTIGLHGKNHYYQEFTDNSITKQDLEKAIQIFQECFNQTPTMFKPPQLKISKQNQQLIKEMNLSLKLYQNQLFHKVYHCNETQNIPNKIIDLF